MTSFYACDGHSHSFPTTQEECDEAKEKCEDAVDAANAANERAALICSVAVLEPTGATKLACAVALAFAAAKVAYATVVCLQADDICSRVQ